MRKSNLDQHFRTHTGMKPYACDKCDKTFTQRVHLKRHLLIHERDEAIMEDTDYLTMSSSRQDEDEQFSAEASTEEQDNFVPASPCSLPSSPIPFNIEQKIKVEEEDF